MELCGRQNRVCYIVSAEAGSIDKTMTRLEKMRISGFILRPGDNCVQREKGTGIFIPLEPAYGGGHAGATSIQGLPWPRSEAPTAAFSAQKTCLSPLFVPLVPLNIMDGRPGS